VTTLEQLGCRLLLITGRGFIFVVVVMMMLLFLFVSFVHAALGIYTMFKADIGKNKNKIGKLVFYDLSSSKSGPCIIVCGRMEATVKATCPPGLAPQPATPRSNWSNCGRFVGSCTNKITGLLQVAVDGPSRRAVTTCSPWKRRAARRRRLGFDDFGVDSTLQLELYVLD
jgi:hypothetical protein